MDLSNFKILGKEMTIETLVIATLFMALLIHTTVTSRRGPAESWKLLRRYFLIALPCYLLFWEMNNFVKVVSAVVIVTTCMSEFIKFPHKKYYISINLVNVFAIILAINGLPEGVTPKTYIGVSFLFGAFFTTFFDTIMLFRSGFLTRLLFLALSHILMFHCVWSSFEMKVGTTI